MRCGASWQSGRFNRRLSAPTGHGGPIRHKLGGVTNQPGLDHRSDAELVDAANLGGVRGEEAFAAIYRRHRDWVVHIAYRFTRDRDLALDVMQDVFVYLLGKFPGFVLTAKLTTFLYPVIRHNALHARRKSGRFAGADGALDELPAPLIDQPGDSDNIEAALAGLPAHQREVLLLRFVDGMTIEEAALALGVPVGTAKSRIHHAIRSLRDDPATKNFFDP